MKEGKKEVLCEGKPRQERVKNVEMSCAVSRLNEKGPKKCSLALPI